LIASFFLGELLQPYFEVLAAYHTSAQLKPSQFPPNVPILLIDAPEEPAKKEKVKGVKFQCIAEEKNCLFGVLGKGQGEREREGERSYGFSERFGANFLHNKRRWNASHKVRTQILTINFDLFEDLNVLLFFQGII
jgi:hypothetical protein